MVIQNEMEANYNAISSAVFVKSFCKRSRETRARQHPNTEEEEEEEEQQHLLDNLLSINLPSGQIEKENNLLKTTEGNADSYTENNSSQTFDAMKTGESGDRLSDEEEIVFKHLSSTPLSFDTLIELTKLSAGRLAAAITILELSDLLITLPGEKYIRTASSKTKTTPGPANMSTEMASTISSFIAFIACNFHGISRKYLQNYLAAYWCQEDRIHWNLGQVLEACFQAPHIKYADILEYVSPLAVKIITPITEPPEESA